MRNNQLYSILTITVVIVGISFTGVLAAAQPIPGIDISAKKNGGGGNKKPSVMAPIDSSAAAAGDSTSTIADVSGNVRLSTQASGATAKFPGKPRMDTTQPPMTRMFSDECETMCKTKCVCDKPGTQSCYCPIPGLLPSRE